jgi:hypothetical protein
MYDAIIAEAKSRGASSLDEFNVIIEELNQRHNASPHPDLLGLSPWQMHQVLYQPFESPDLVTFDTRYTPNAPIVQIFDLLVDAIGQKGIKATATGNLPRQLCRDILAACPSDSDYYNEDVNRLRTEIEFDALHCTRIIARLAKLISLRQGRFRLTAKGTKLIQPKYRDQRYFELFKTYTRGFNWGYRDIYPEANIIQTGFLFTLYALLRCGNQPRPSTFYEDAFIQAFPMLTEEFGHTPYVTEEKQARRCYTLRSLERFAHFFGLIDLTPAPRRLQLHREPVTVQATPTLARLVTFHD